jgi:hypothetical protein
MTDRRNFSLRVQVEIRQRATVAGVRYCEKCGDQAMRGDVHHKKQDAMEIDKSRRLTAADGLYLCLWCHKIETKRQAAELALVLAREASHLGAKKPGKVKIGKREKPPRLPVRVANGVPALMRRGFVPAGRR